jgi:hypothetical protein
MENKLMMMGRRPDTSRILVPKVLNGSLILLERILPYLKSSDNFNKFHKTHGHDANECKVLFAQAKKMNAAWEAGGSTNYKKQKSDFQAKKTEQMFSFMVNAFRKATENKPSLNSENNKKRKQMNIMHLIKNCLISLTWKTPKKVKNLTWMKNENLALVYIIFI